MMWVKLRWGRGDTQYMYNEMWFMGTNKNQAMVVLEINENILY